jgi:hypothetical protein
MVNFNDECELRIKNVNAFKNIKLSTMPDSKAIDNSLINKF